MVSVETPSRTASRFVRTIPELSEDEFRLFQALVLRESGIHLGQKNRAMVVARLWKRLSALDLQSFSAYYRLVKADARELVHMLDCICTNETHFFREPAAFDCLRDHVFPEWREAAKTNHRSRTIRVWSAACSSGEEPYSLAMTLLTHFPASEGWKVEVFATDLSTKVLARAAAGVWPADKISTVPVEYQKRFLLKGFGPEKGKIKIGEELREVVKFQRLNLQHEPYPVVTPFDLIFCRNVIIYFQWETKLRVVNQLGKHLASNGYLFLGHAESLHAVTDKLQSVTPKMFRSPKHGATRSSALCVLQRRRASVRDDAV